ncbi:aminodeoxychorismate lyase [soil metagenome]
MLRSGPSVFETVELRDGRPFALEAHLELLRSGAERLGLPPIDVGQVEQAVATVAEGWGRSPGRLRITWFRPDDSLMVGDAPTRGRLLVSVAPFRLLRSPAHVMLAGFPIDPGGLATGLKSGAYTASVAALAGSAGADEVLMGTTDGELCSGATSNVVVGIDGRMRTPRGRSGRRAGVTISLLTEALAAQGITVHQDEIRLAELSRVDEMFLVSTTRPVQPVRSLDGVELPSCPGPLTEQARRALERWRDLSR